MPRLFIKLFGFSYTIKEIDFDYSKYLGPNYEKPRKPTAYVINHITTITDCMIEYIEFKARSVTGMITGNGLAARSIRKIGGLIEVTRSGPGNLRDK